MLSSVIQAWIISAAAVLICLAHVGCADAGGPATGEVATPVQLQSAATKEEIVLPQTIEPQLQWGVRGGELEKGSRWRLVGTIPRGNVYQRVGQVWMVGSVEKSEAYLVVKDNNVTGVYLAGKSGFLPCARPTPLLQEKGRR